MQPWGWLESGPQAGEAVDRLAGKPIAWSVARPAIEAQLAALKEEPGEAVQVSLSAFDGQPWFITRMIDGSRLRLDAHAAPAPFDEGSQERAAELLGGDKAAQVDLMTAEDDYYYKGSAASDFPVVRVKVTEAGDTRFYLDPVSGAVRFVADPGARGFRWLHLGLHRIDFFAWLRARPVWDIVVWLLMLGVTAVCALGVWMGVKKLARGGKLENLPD